MFSRTHFSGILCSLGCSSPFLCLGRQWQKKFHATTIVEIGLGSQKMDFPQFLLKHTHIDNNKVFMLVTMGGVVVGGRARDEIRGGGMAMAWSCIIVKRLHL